MKPLSSETEDQDALRTLGRASAQIVHDLKNQLNGLKLYATFLKKRLETSERPAEELDTINKLIAGLDRSAKHVSMIVDYSRPVQLKKQAGTDLEKIVRQIVDILNTERVSHEPTSASDKCPSLVVKAGPTSLLGDFDPVLISDALRRISLAAVKLSTGNASESLMEIHLKDESAGSTNYGVIEWPVFDSSDHDPFHSFAGSNEIGLSLAAKVIEAHGGSAKRENGKLCVRLPLGHE
jgi:signal transduction histidine kinase